ncbi:uncharacterized protein ARMOST_21916 [Armillaria ostoyae]|uniref:Integrase catalytic domain-containing protein n=1 Tax=Armillaria ostoyae TaxID=47428 RepID=A0A284SBD7_ARMOS|nr:uncharacterized protein ARMOST_21916 [Armillaria ostoyae]
MEKSSPHSHDHITIGHPEITKTQELVLHDYWWPKMKKDVEAYVKGCETCQQTKTSMQAKAAPLNPNAISTSLKDALLVIVDQFSKAIIPIACNIELSVEGWARLLRDHVYACHRMPQVVISDRGPQFVSKFMKELYQMLDITQNASMAFHPQTDGQME